MECLQNNQQCCHWFLHPKANKDDVSTFSLEDGSWDGQARNEWPVVTYKGDAMAAHSPAEASGQLDTIEPAVKIKLNQRSISAAYIILHYHLKDLSRRLDSQAKAQSQV
jgi:hypothetical protein